MRYLNICLLSILLHSILNAQTTTTTYSEEQSIEEQKIINANSDFYANYEDVRRLWKFGYANFTNHALPITTFTQPRNFNLKGFEAGVEQRIATGISLGLNIRSNLYDANIQQLSSNADQSILSADFNSNLFNVEARWYFQKRKRIQQGLSGNNLSGAYLGLNGAVDNWTLSVNKFQLGEEILHNLDRVKGTNYQTFLAAGWQHQTNGLFYLNLRLGAGFVRSPIDLSTFTLGENGETQLTSTNKWKGVLDYQVSFGINLFGKREIRLPKDYTVLSYFEEGKQLWKIDLLNIVNGFSDKGIQGKIGLEYERKLGSTPFSINPLVEFHYDIPFSEKSPEHQFNFGTEFRYYYNLKRLMQKGWVGNSLFANYVATYVDHSSAYSRPRIGFQYGNQWRLFNKLYLDSKILFDAQTHSAEANGFFNRFGVQYKIGFAF